MCVIVSAKAYIVNIKKNNAESPPSASWVVNVQLYLLYTHLVSELPTLLVSQQMMSWLISTVFWTRQHWENCILMMNNVLSNLVTAAPSV